MLSHVCFPLVSAGSGLGFEELAECGSDLSNHVSGGGGAAILLKGLVVALPCERARTPGGHQEWAGPGRQETSQSLQATGTSTRTWNSDGLTDGELIFTRFYLMSPN